MGFRVIDIFCKNAVLNICRYLKRFYTYKKIDNSFLKFDHSLVRMTKIIEIGQIFPAEKRDLKTQSQRAHKQVRATLIHRSYLVLSHTPHMTFFDTRNGFPGSGRGSGRIKVYKRMLTGSPLLSPPPPTPPPSTLTCSLFHLPAISVSPERATFHSTKSP